MSAEARKKPTPVEPSEIVAAVRAYGEGASIRLIAAAIGRPYSTVRHVLVSQDVRLRPRGGWQRQRLARLLAAVDGVAGIAGVGGGDRG